MSLHQCPGKTMLGHRCKRMLKSNAHCKHHSVQFLQWAKDKPSECCICVEGFCDTDRPLSCGHWVHSSCIVKWGKQECPICRETITLNKKDTNKIKKNNAGYDLSEEVLINHLHQFVHEIVDGDETFLLEIENVAEELVPVVTFFTNMIGDMINGNFDDSDDEIDEI